MQIILLALIFLSFTALGGYIFLGYKNRRVFFENALSFCDHLAIEISFSKNIVLQVIDRYKQSYGRAFKEVLEGYSTLLYNKQDVTRDSIDNIMWNRLKPFEKEIVLEFFYELGRHGASEENEKLANKKVQFERIHEDAIKSQKREASIYLKICIILGIAAVILLI